MKKIVFLFLFASLLSNILAIAQDTERQDVVQDILKQKKIKMPQFPGGEIGLINYLSKHVRYPKEAVRDSISGKVIHRFTVGKDGEIVDVEVIKPLFPACDDEAVRVVNAMPKWKPGSLDGQNISVVYTLPLVFKPN